MNLKLNSDFNFIYTLDLYVLTFISKMIVGNGFILVYSKCVVLYENMQIHCHIIAYNAANNINVNMHA